MSARYTNGNVTVGLDDGLEAFARSLLSAAETETVRVLEEAGDQELEKSEAAWYGPDGVTRRTGKSGDMTRVTLFDSARGEVRVSLGSSDARENSDPKKKGPVPYYVRRPGPLSLVDKVVTQGEWWKAKKAGLPVRMFGPKGDRKYIVEEPNPKASDGKSLIVELVRKPVNARLRDLAPELAQAIATKATGGN